MEKNRLITQVSELSEQIQQLTNDKKQLAEQVEVFALEVKDMEKDKEIAVKRQHAEMRELRESLSKEVKLK